MKKIILVIITAILLVSCKQELKKEERFPENLGKVFQYHGSMDAWKKYKTLSFNKGTEVHTIDLHSRKTAVHNSGYSLGFNGKDIWLSEKDSVTFKGNKDFYHNLYFYFYAMPFVLADDGIIYEEIKPIVFEGKQFPGYKISFKANIGTSPDDNYYVYYNPATFQMEWLGYTVTFYSKKPSEKSNLIRYQQWETVNNMLLPKEITWYQKDDNGNPTAPKRAPTVFTLPLLSESELPDSFYEKPNE